MGPPDLFAPSAYSAQLLLAARPHAASRRPARVMEMGVGSGVVLASLLQAGAQQGWGVDIEPAAVTRAQQLLHDQGLSDRCTVEQGQLWSRSKGCLFDLVVANLPHFASEDSDDGVHLPSWSIGGADGRRLLDPFLHGLAEHLAPGGTAFVTHNVFVGLERTHALVHRLGLEAQVVHSASAVLPLAKLASMTPAVREQSLGRSVHRLGPYAFVDFDVLRIQWPDRGA